MDDQQITGSRSDRHGGAEKDHSSEAAPTKKKKKRRFWKAFKIFSFVSLSAAIIGGGAAAGYVATIAKRAPVLDLNGITNMAATTKVYDSDKQFMFALQGDGNRDLIKSTEDVSPFVVNAFISAEDKNFRSHFGINPYAMARAFAQNAIGRSIKSGASTITQQTIKNAMFPEQDRTWERKIQEAYLAIQLEKQLTKDEIIVTYLNWIYFGKSGTENLYGIERASKSIFNKSAKDLNLAESTVLASLPNNPSLFNVYENLDNVLDRQEYILREMLQNGYIDAAQYEEAKKFDISADLQSVQQKKEIKAGLFPHLNAELETRAAEELLKTGKYESLDQARQALFRGGYQIYTTIDRNLQTTVDTVLNNPDFYPKNLTYDVTDNKGKTTHVENAMEQSGATLIDNKTGRVLAMGGGRNYEQDQINHATRARQPGSTMKPIAVYGPAIDMKKIGSGSVIDDVPMVWPDQNAADGKYFPMNWDKKFHGLMTVRKALEQSYNIPALKVFHDITPKAGLDYVRKMGVTTLVPEDENLSAGIGGLSHGLTVLEATSAYTTFPNAGVWRDAFMIDEITDRDGNSVYKHESKTDQVFSSNTAFIINDMLKDVVRKGTASEVGRKFPSIPIAGKTGTTNEDKDAWFIGYTPDVTLGIWVGYNLPRTLLSGEGNRPKKLWNEIMAELLPTQKEHAEAFFPNPGGVRQIGICSYSGKLPSELCNQQKAVSTEMFLAGSEPREQDDVLVKAKYFEVGGKKFLATDSTPAYLVKEGVFIKRDKYELPDNNKSYLPLDWEMELPAGDAKDGVSVQSDKTPNGLKITASTTNSISLTWNAVSGAKSYLILRANSEAGPFQIVEEVTTPAFTDPSVQTGTSYSYQVVALDNDGAHSAPSSTVTVTPGQVSLAVPSSVQATPAPVGLTISWSAVPNATGYTIYRNTEAGGTFQKVGSTSDTTFTDVGALPGATFYYKVTALAGSQESNASPPVKGTVSGGNGGTGNNGGPAGDGNSGTGSQTGKAQPPSSVGITKTANGLVINWGSASGAQSYVVERSTNGSTWAQVGSATDTSYTDSTAEANQKYYYRVRSVSADGTTSTPSQTVSGTK
ncbi:PBP1A family penicillin-binding protein [Tumebacillus permanentifrigoris]|uniref:Penicillin-binding protein/penicillin-binding protein 1A n=1 Tax=Tumebacillus permanentifrigoris TaxID=378543 RepID=A0A316DE79_9BACL|nr:PBP1A family penicillin-binding protein [Tumebacillus permanentifrigoris]PWK13977.1 penicillin-binding protein/penicillin-binding protein 1A [Tumebacillus permanentifrigoris]